MAKVLFVICVPSEKNTKIAKTINANKDKEGNKSDKTKDADGDLDSEVIDSTARRLKYPRNSLPALFKTGTTGIVVTEGSNTDVTDGSLRTPNHVNGEESLKNIFLDVSGNKNQNTDAGKTLIKSNSCSLNRLSLLKNKDEVKKSDNVLNGNKTEIDEVDLSKKTLKQNESLEKPEQNGNHDEDHETEYVSFVSDGLTLLERVKTTLSLLDISAVNWSRTEDDVNVGMFIAADGVRCEEILEKLTYLDLGAIPGSSISVFPATISVASVVKNDQAEKLKLEMEK